MEQREILRSGKFMTNWEILIAEKDDFPKNTQNVIDLIDGAEKVTYADGSEVVLLPPDDPSYAQYFMEMAENGFLFWTDGAAYPFYLQADKKGTLSFSEQPLTPEQYTKLFPPKDVEEPKSPGIFSWAGHYLSKLFGGKGNEKVNDYLDKKAFYEVCAYRDQFHAGYRPEKSATVEKWEREIMAAAYCVSQDMSRELRPDSEEYQRIFAASSEEVQTYANTEDAEKLFDMAVKAQKSQNNSGRLKISENAELFSDLNRLGLNIRKMRGEVTAKESQTLSPQERAEVARRNYDELGKRKIEAIKEMIDKDLKDTPDLYDQMQELLTKEKPDAKVIDLMYNMSQRMPEGMPALKCYYIQQNNAYDEDFDAKKFLKRVAAGFADDEDTMQEIVLAYRENVRPRNAAEVQPETVHNQFI